MGARSTCAATGDASDGLPQQQVAWHRYAFFSRVPSRPERDRLRRKPERGDRVSLGRRPVLGGRQLGAGQSIVAPDLSGKRLELLKDTVPTCAIVAVIWNPTNSAVRELRRAR